MICPDCAAEGFLPTCVYDLKQTGEVCPRCERVFSILNSNPNHFHYASEKAYKAKIEKDRMRNVHKSVSTKALVERILRPID